MTNKIKDERLIRVKKRNGTQEQQQQQQQDQWYRQCDTKQTRPENYLYAWSVQQGQKMNERTNMDEKGT